MADVFNATEPFGNVAFSAKPRLLDVIELIGFDLRSTTPDQPPSHPASNCPAVCQFSLWLNRCGAISPRCCQRYPSGVDASGAFFFQFTPLTRSDELRVEDAILAHLEDESERISSEPPLAKWSRIEAQRKAQQQKEQQRLKREAELAARGTTIEQFGEQAEGWEVYDPTPDEIAANRAAFQSTWDREERTKRRLAVPGSIFREDLRLIASSEEIVDDLTDVQARFNLSAAKDRVCLRCNKLFFSLGPHNRRCPDCCYDTAHLEVEHERETRLRCGGFGSICNEDGTSYDERID